LFAILGDLVIVFIITLFRLVTIFSSEMRKKMPQKFAALQQTCENQSRCRLVCIVVYPWRNGS